MHNSPVALVTGGSRGLGRGICVELAKKGYAVAVNYASNESAALETKEALPEGATSLLVQGDVSVGADRTRMVESVLAEFDRIDVLVNNAGITSVGRKDILDATTESWDRVMGVNLEGPFFLSKLVANAMIERDGKLHQPCLFNISSLSAYAISTDRGDYCISKAGMTMMTQLFAARLAEHGIRVYEVRPGVMDTDMTAGALDKYTKKIAEGMNPIRRWGTAEDVGRVVALLASEPLTFSTGDVINVDGGYHLRRFP